MKTDTPAIDKGMLAQCLREEYGQEVRALRFLPKGEEAYSYLAEGEGRSWFVKAYPPKLPVDLEAALGATDRLKREFGLAEVLPPHRTREGRATFRFGAFTVAVFDLIEGSAAYEEPLHPDEEIRLARFFAKLHSIDRGAFPGLPVKDFSLWFRDRLLSVLEFARTHEGGPKPHRWELVRRLREGYDGILRELETADRLGASCRASADAPALTHGDPTSGNVMKDTAGHLWVIDWGGLAWGAREQDLAPYTGEGFRRFLAAYAEESPDLRLSMDRFAFYLHEWNLQEIADYSYRLLHDDPDEEEIAYSFSELNQYLPVREGSVQAMLQRIEADMKQVLGKRA
ncbi:MAG: aminoglycoside phosphotransferase family protein [Armatimonadetes bacterium]|nr:aminoglycoside phosphotransferase family protein [Armatimonadota bacterium]